MKRRLLLFCILTCATPLIGQSWVSTVSPTQNRIDVALDTEIQIVFTQDLDPSSVTDEAIRIHGRQTGFYTASPSYDQAARTVTLVADARFRAGESVTISVGTAIRNSSGQGMPATFSWQFTGKANSSTASLSVTSTVSVNSVPYSIVTGDLDGDGDLDLATANRGSNAVALLVNDGSGVFENRTTFSVGQLPEYVTTGDLDRDGDLDLAIANASSNSVSVLQNDGSANFAQATPIAVLSSPHTVNAGDLDGDGDIDLVASNFGSARMSVLLNDGSGSFSSTSTPNVGTGPELGLINDLDRDGDLDLAVPNFNSGNVFILKNGGTGVFTTSATIMTGISPHLPGAGDLDNDGDVDLIITNSTSVSILSNSGTANFSQSTIATSGRPWSGTAADLDGDGDLDFAITKYSGNRVALFINNGGFSETAQINVGVRPHLVVSGDFDGDGSIDLAVANDGSNTVTILKNQVVTSVAADESPQPEEFVLRQNFPNPFNPSTRIEYNLVESRHTELVIYNLLGSTVRSLVKEVQTSGMKSVLWDGKNDKGQTVPAGLYFYQLRAGTLRQSRSMVLLK